MSQRLSIRAFDEYDDLSRDAPEQREPTRHVVVVFLLGLHTCLSKLARATWKCIADKVVCSWNYVVVKVIHSLIWSLALVNLYTLWQWRDGDVTAMVVLIHRVTRLCLHADSETLRWAFNTSDLRYHRNCSDFFLFVCGFAIAGACPWKAHWCVFLLAQLVILGVILSAQAETPAQVEGYNRVTLPCPDNPDYGAMAVHGTDECWMTKLPV